MDPFAATSAIDTGSKGRGLAVARFGDRMVAFVAQEFAGQIGVFELSAGQWAARTPYPLGGGPRALCVFGNQVLVAATSGGVVELLEYDGAELAPVASVVLDEPPSAVACADLDGDAALDALAVTGSGPDAALVRLTGPTLAVGAAVPFVSASYVRFADLDLDGDQDAIALATSTHALGTLRNDAGTFSMATALSLPCGAPRAAGAAASTAAVDVVVACDGEVVVVGQPLAPEPTTIAIGAPPQLYDLVRGDFDHDAIPDWASVGIGEHTVTVALASAGGARTFDHPVARGPVALEAFDVEEDGDLDLIVLSFEQPRLSLFVNNSQ